MPRPSLSLDTTAEIERLQVDGWRAMTPVQKAEIVSGLTQSAYELARAGVRARYPTASPREQFLRLAIDVLGRDLACRAYPDATALRDFPL